MKATLPARSLRLALLGAVLAALSGCVMPYQQPPPRSYDSAPRYGDGYSGRSYRSRGAYNDSGSTAHCGVDYDHAPHWYHSRMHHEHYCPGGPHHHH